MFTDHKTGFTVYLWAGEEDDIVHLFPTTARLAITRVPLHYSSHTDLNNLLIRFARVTDVEKQTLDKADLTAAQVTIDRDKLSVIPKEFNTVFDKQMCKNQHKN